MFGKSTPLPLGCKMLRLCVSLITSTIVASYTAPIDTPYLAILNALIIAAGATKPRFSLLVLGIYVLCHLFTIPSLIFGFFALAPLYYAFLEDDNISLGFHFEHSLCFGFIEANCLAPWLSLATENRFLCLVLLGVFFSLLWLLKFALIGRLLRIGNTISLLSLLVIPVIDFLIASNPIFPVGYCRAFHLPIFRDLSVIPYYVGPLGLGIVVSFLSFYAAKFSFIRKCGVLVITTTCPS